MLRSTDLWDLEEWPARVRHSLITRRVAAGTLTGWLFASPLTSVLLCRHHSSLYNRVKYNFIYSVVAVSRC